MNQRDYAAFFENLAASLPPAQAAVLRMAAAAARVGGDFRFTATAKMTLDVGPLRVTFHQVEIETVKPAPPLPVGGTGRSGGKGGAK